MLKTQEEDSQDATDGDENLRLIQVCLLKQPVHPGRASPEPFICVEAATSSLSGNGNKVFVLSNWTNLCFV